MTENTPPLLFAPLLVILAHARIFFEVGFCHSEWGLSPEESTSHKCPSMDSSVVALPQNDKFYLHRV